jgi:large subunit ribosomal protein L24
MHIKKGDTVKILTGKDKGKTGKVLKAFPKENKVLVEGVNIYKKHERARKEGQKGQVVERSVPIQASNVVNVENLKKNKENRIKKTE